MGEVIQPYTPRRTDSTTQSFRVVLSKTVGCYSHKGIWLSGLVALSALVGVGADPYSDGRHIESSPDVEVEIPVCAQSSFILVCKRVVKLVNTRGLNPLSYGFESRHAYQQ